MKETLALELGEGGGDEYKINGHKTEIGVERIEK